MKTRQEIIADIEKLLKRNTCNHLKTCDLCPLTDYHAPTRTHNIAMCCRPEGRGWNGWTLRRTTVEELSKMMEHLKEEQS